MPYIPPPRPPPAPRPPVFRPPPGPNIHQQQMRQLHHQQQQFRQQQQIRQFHQTQQQLVANQTRLQMERNQQQQQQLQRQQQEHFRQQQQLHQDNLHRQHQDQTRGQQQFHQDNLHRQHQDQTRGQQQFHQDNLHRQHQDQTRGQQQFHQGQQDQLRKQQQFLQGFQTSSGTVGSSVFISPAFTVQIPGVGFGQATAEGANSGGDATDYGGPSQGTPQVGQPFPSAPPPTSLPPQQQATPTPMPGSEFPPMPGSEFPPPYSGPPPPIQQQFPQPQSLPPKFDPSQNNEGPPSSQQINSVGVLPPQADGNPPPKKSRPAKNKLILRDGTCITIRSKDEYLFVGPHGQQMVINCLPLFTPRSNTVQAESATVAPGDTAGSDDKETVKGKVQKQDIHNSMHEGRKKARQGTKAARRFVLKKASSNESLLTATSTTAAAPKCDTMKRSSEAEDILDVTVRSNVEVHRDRWTHFNSSYQNAVSPTSAVESNTVLLKPAEMPVEEPLKTKDGGVHEGEREGEDGKREGVGEGETVDERKKDGGEREGGASQTLSDGGSDGEGEKELRVSYIENPEQVETLKRSSGSVSFIVNAPPLVRKMAKVCPSPPPSVAEDMVEAGDGASATGEGGKVTCEGGEGDKVTCVGGESEEDAGGVIGEVAPTDGSADVEKPKIETAEVEPGMQNVTPEPAPSEEEQPSKDTSLQNSVLTQTAPLQTASGPPIQNPPAPTPSGPPQEQTVEQLQNPLVTPLPSAPMTFEPEFIERSGWLTKLSHRRGVFGDKWQKRYFVLHGSWIYYFKKYGDSIPRGVIRLHPGAWVKSVSQGTARQSDAVAKTPSNAVISVVRCFGVHRPDNFASSLSNLLSQDGVADVFRSQTISISNSDSRSRTFYMIAPSNEERDAWVDAIDNNIKAHTLSPAALETSCKELCNMLQAIQSYSSSDDLSPLLSLLHTRTRELGHHDNSREH